jgi:hypothetical protein
MRTWCCLILITSAAIGFAAPQRPEFPPEVRLAQLVQANVVAVHAYQVLLAKKAGKGDAACYSAGALSDAELEALVAHQAGLLAADRLAVKAWTKGQASKFDPAADLDPILQAPLRIPDNAPVNVVSGWLKDQITAPPAHVRALANLYQTILEVDRDGDLLQEEFDFYIALGLPVYLGQFSVSGTDENFLAVGRGLAERTCESPFATDAAAWQIAARKIWNWAEKKLHIRDESIVAGELLREPEFATLLPAVRSLPPQRIAIIGHSFTMGAHWSSPSSFVPIVSSMISRENRKVVFRQFEGGGLTASRAQKMFFKDALAWKPDKVLMVVMTRRDEDYATLKEMGLAFAKAHAQCIVFDNIHDPEATDPQVVARFNETARAAGMTIIEVDKLLSSAADRNQFVCLDGIHMREPYHRLMAREWFRFLAGARPEALAK